MTDNANRHNQEHQPDTVQGPGRSAPTSRNGRSERRSCAPGCPPPSAGHAGPRPDRRVLLGKRLARPIKAIAAQAHLVADLDLDEVQPLPRSRVLEFDDQAGAFNAMLTGLRAFSAYVPRSLVARLVRTGDADVTRPRQAILTVMFTDMPASPASPSSCRPMSARRSQPTFLVAMRSNRCRGRYGRQVPGRRRHGSSAPRPAEGPWRGGGARGDRHPRSAEGGHRAAVERGLPPLGCASASTPAR